MKQTHTKNKLYILPALLFCMNLQGTETSHIKNSFNHDNHNNQVNQNTLDAFNLAVTRKKHGKPKPQNNAEAQNIIGWQQNNTESYNMPGTQNIDGSFDSSFGPNGRGYVIDQIGTSCEARAVAMQHNDKIIVTGVSENKAVLIRYNNDGKIDTQFGGANGTGVVTNDRFSSFNTILIQKDKKIVAAGRTGNQFALARYYENGTLDTLFGNQGIADFKGQGGEITAIALQDNNIIVTGNDNSGSIVLARFNRLGILDTTFAPTFHTPGIRITRIGNHARSYALAIEENNRIVVAGLGNQTQMAIIRYTENGELDTTFGPDSTGIVTLTIGNGSSSAYGITIEKNRLEHVRRIYITGQSDDSNGTAVFTTVRLNANGSKDTIWGNGHGSNAGIRFDSPQGASHPAYARSIGITHLPLTNDDKIIVMGQVNVNNINNFTLLRYNRIGQLDPAFGINGIQSNTLNMNLAPNLSPIPVVGALQLDEKKVVLVSNYATTSTAVSRHIAVARYWA